jgi:hypothetical protein
VEVTTKQSAEPHGTYLVLGLLIAAGAIMFLLLAPRNQDPDPEAEASQAAARDIEANANSASGAPKPAVAMNAAAPADQAAPAEPVAPAAAPQRSDLFSQPLPDNIERVYKRVSNNQWLNANDQKLLYQYGQEHKDDARPQLMLAWDARNREWDGIAARMYRIAFSADTRAKDDPSMLPDLISIASRFDNVEYQESSSLIKDAYGAQALPEIEDEIVLATRRGEQRRLARLNQLRDQIRNH